MQATLLLLAFVKLQTLMLFFLCFSAFCEFQCHFYKNKFFIYYGNILLHFSLEGFKIHKIFSLATSNKFAIKNNRLMQMSLTFHETLIKTNRKYENFKARLSSFSGIKKRKLERKGRGGVGG